MPAGYQGVIIDETLKIMGKIWKHTKNLHTIFLALSESPLGLIDVPGHVPFPVFPLIEIHNFLGVTQPVSKFRHVLR
jgi:hypothetical protein